MPCCGRRILDYRHSVDTLSILHPGGPFLMKAGVGISGLIQSVCPILSTHRVLTPPLRVSASENMSRQLFISSASYFPQPFLRERGQNSPLFTLAECRGMGKIRNYGEEKSPA